MSFQYTILGSGRQGVALAYDLAAHCESERIILADANLAIAQRGTERLRALLPDAADRFTAAQCDVNEPASLIDTISGADVVISAVPYRFNETLTDAAIATETHFCDLGGNTNVVRAQLERHEQAQAVGVSIVPDCGLAPGLGNALAAHGIAQLDVPHAAHVRCGGLPQKPVGPLGYKLLFNFQGLINEYSGYGEFLRNGRIVYIPALTEVEDLSFPDAIGECEAAVTSGGTSTCAHSLQGKVRNYDYKTIRYPGHFAIIRAMFRLGCFDEEVELKTGEIVRPKPLLRKLMEDRLDFPHVRDITVLRATVSGNHAGRPTTRIYELIDVFDQRTGFTAMERTTAFPTALVAYLQARKLIDPGARPLELSIPLDRYLEELGTHGIDVKVHADE